MYVFRTERVSFISMEKSMGDRARRIYASDQFSLTGEINPRLVYVASKTAPSWPDVL